MALTTDDNQVHYVKKFKKPLDLGCYIYGLDNNFYTEEEWQSSGKSKEDVLGIAVKIDNDCIYLLHPTTAGRIFSTNKNFFTGCTTTTNQQEAKNDLNGERNTTALVSQLSGDTGSMFNWVINTPYADGKQGYIPSLGEAYKILRENETLEKIHYLASIAGIERFNVYDGVTTSTQYDNDKYWA